MTLLEAKEKVYLTLSY